MFQGLLTVVSHLGMLVIEEVVFESGTKLRGKVVTYSHSQQGGHVVARLGTVLISRNLVAKHLKCGSPFDIGHLGSRFRIRVLDAC